MWPLLWVLTGCEPCPTYGPGTADEAWREHVAEIEGEFAQSGECPSEPPEEVVTSWGCGYEPEVTVFEEGARFVLASAGHTATDLFVSATVLSTTDNLGCDSLTPEYTLDRQNAGIDRLQLSVHASSPDLPAFVSDIEIASVTSYTDGRSTGGSYSWICLAQAPGPSGAEYRAPSDAWQGSAFVHGDATAETPTVDAFVAFGHIDCVEGGEDEGAGSDDYGTWDEHCDGIDNDFDGQVDEGAVDSDSDGIADCNE